jgi:pimeloyl-ACP methyl ester carboxylesterase
MKNRVCNFTQVAGKEIYYEIIFPECRKPGTPFLVFLHEGLGSIRQWKDFPEAIGKKVHCPVLVYDRYGYGRSEAFAEPRTSDYLNKEAFIFLPELLSKLQITEKVILVGHSDGGSIALLYASKYSENVLGLITEADHLFCEDITIAGIKKAVIDYKDGKLKSSLQKFHGDKTDSMFYGWSDVWTAEENKDWNIEHFLHSITCPVLAIQGKDDAYGSEKQLLSKKNNISGLVEIMFIDDCGHIPHFQAIREVKCKMLSFVMDCVSSLT